MNGLQFTYLRQASPSNRALPLLRIQDLYVRVGIRRVLEDLNLDLYEEDAILLTGPNGSGKSTLLNAIAGLEPAQVESGKILLDGEDITNLPPHKRAQAGLGYLRQRENVFPALTVAENLVLAIGPDGHERFAATYPAWAEDLPLHKRANHLSGGQRQRLAWAMATLRTSRLLMADEPEAGLSHKLQLPEGATYLVVSHNTATLTESAS